MRIENSKSISVLMAKHFSESKKRKTVPLTIDGTNIIFCLLFEQSVTPRVASLVDFVFVVSRADHTR